MNDPFLFIDLYGFRLLASGWLAIVAVISIAAVAGPLVGPILKRRWPFRGTLVWPRNRRRVGHRPGRRSKAGARPAVPKTRKSLSRAAQRAQPLRRRYERLPAVAPDRPFRGSSLLPAPRMNKVGSSSILPLSPIADRQAARGTSSIRVR
jgi:hypothetical protein